MQVDHKKLAKLVVVQEVTHRQLADVAGWSSHSYVSRLLRGEVTTMKPEPAVRIAKFLGVPLEDLFVTKLATNHAHNVRDSCRKKVS